MAQTLAALQLTTVEQEAPVRAVAPQAASAESIVALFPDGRLYGGDLLTDIVRYRELRCRALVDGSGHDNNSSTRLMLLETRLRWVNGPSRRPEEQRAFRRFNCSFGAGLEVQSAEGALVTHVVVENISADSCEIHLTWAPEYPLAEGQEVSLVVRVNTPQGLSNVRLRGRLSTASAEGAVIRFAGAPTAAEPS